MSMAKEPAFPRTGVHTGTRNHDGEAVIENEQNGMTYRQWLIGMAVQGLCANWKITESLGLMLERGEIKSAKVAIGLMACSIADDAIKAQEK